MDKFDLMSLDSVHSAVSNFSLVRKKIKLLLCFTLNGKLFARFKYICVLRNGNVIKQTRRPYSEREKFQMRAFQLLKHFQRPRG